MTAEGKNSEATQEDAPKAPVPNPMESVAGIVADKVADIVDNIPQDDPVVPDDGNALSDMLGKRIDERMQQFEDKVNAMFVKMGGTVREGADAATSAEAPLEQEYVPLDKLDYRI